MIEWIKRISRDEDEAANDILKKRQMTQVNATVDANDHDRWSQ